MRARGRRRGERADALLCRGVERHHRRLAQGGPRLGARARAARLQRVARLRLLVLRLPARLRHRRQTRRGLPLRPAGVGRGSIPAATQALADRALARGLHRRRPASAVRPARVCRAVELAPLHPARAEARGRHRLRRAGAAPPPDEPHPPRRARPLQAPRPRHRHRRPRSLPPQAQARRPKRCARAAALADPPHAAATHACRRPRRRRLRPAAGDAAAPSRCAEQGAVGRRVPVGGGGRAARRARRAQGCAGRARLDHRGAQVHAAGLLLGRGVRKGAHTRHATRRPAAGLARARPARHPPAGGASLALRHGAARRGAAPPRGAAPAALVRRLALHGDARGSAGGGGPLAVDPHALLRRRHPLRHARARRQERGRRLGPLLSQDGAPGRVVQLPRAGRRQG
mmetsp:Transcript_4787/g.15366  ORF Transcript_4787/g.15366 Transcript_4787/m.15366 type:complete len:401 (+) Transcript_4787:2418-3620(+)